MKCLQSLQDFRVYGLVGYDVTIRRELSNNPTCRKCGVEEQTSVNILWDCEALASPRRTHLGSFFLGPEDIRKQIIRAIWNFGKETGLL
jgi:hypothetical protein